MSIRNPHSLLQFILLQFVVSLRYAIILITLGALAGCAEDPNAVFTVYPVTGKLAWKDGRPLPDKLGITLQSMGPKNVQAIGTVKKDGTFSQFVFMGFGGDGRSGTIPGKHRVILQLRVPVGEEAVSMTPAQRDEVAAQVRMFAPYSSYDRTPLEIEVTPQSGEFQLVLDPATDGKKK